MNKPKIENEYLGKLPALAVDGEAVKEIFFHVGLAFYTAHSFEECLKGLLVGFFIVDNPLRWRENYENEVKNLDKLTLGRLLKRVQKLVSFSDEIILDLELSLKKRNYFIHNYFYDSFGLLANRKGHEQIIEDMIEFKNIFERSVGVIAPLTSQLMIKAGMSKEQIYNFIDVGIRDQLKNRGID